MTNEERTQAIAKEFPLGCEVVSDHGPPEWHLQGIVIGHGPYVVEVRGHDGTVWKSSATLVRRVAIA